MSVPNNFPQYPSQPQGPRSFPPMNPHTPQYVPDQDLRHDSRDGRARWSAGDGGRTRSRSISTPPDNRYNYNPNLISQPPTGFSPASADVSRAWAQNPTRGWTTGNVDPQVQNQGMVQVGGQPVTQTRLDPRYRRNSFGHPPGLSSGHTLISSPVNPHVQNRLRRDSYRRPRILFYHRHEPHYGFTNFSDHSVMYNGRSYPTSEHLFQSFKFTHRPGLAEHIRTCSPRPSVAFSEARRFAQEVRSDWIQDNIKVMDMALYLKFTQHRDLKRELLSTGDAELIENSDKDSFWGCGADGKGRNELGLALERLRTQLRAEAERR